LRVPRKVQAATGAFYGRLRVYDAALSAGDGAGLAAALARNVPAADGHSLASDALASYALETASRLGAESFQALGDGRAPFPGVEEP
jgi:cytochrome b pre-mRNA-processing protein 3